jgi:TolA-binding protein
MTKRINLFTVFLLLAIVFTAAPFTAKADDEKEISKNWAMVMDAYKTSPTAKDTYDKLDNFAARWKDNNRLEASRAVYLKGVTLQGLKKYQEELDVFKSVLDQYSSSPYADSADYKMGEALYNMGKYDDAIDVWNAFRFKYSNSLFMMEAVYGISLSYLNTKEFKKADRELSDFLAKSPYYAKDDNIKFIGGLIDYYLGRYDDAAAKLSTLKTDAAYYYYGQSLLRQVPPKYLDASEAFKSVSEGDDAKNSKYLESALYNKAEAFYKGENYKVAADDYTSFISLFPGSPLEPYAVYKKGAALFKDKKYDQAALVYKQVMDSSGDKRVKAYALYLVGECMLKQNKFAEALASYQKVLDGYPDVYDAFSSSQVKAGWCYVSLKQYEKAEEVLTSFTQKFTTHDSLPLGYYLLGNSFYEQKKYGPALEAYKFILDKFKYSDLTEASLLMEELCYYNQGQYAILTSEASATLNILSEKFQSPKPNIRARAYYYLGASYMKTGIYGLAAKSFQQIVESYYDSDITVESRANLAWCFYEVENFKGARTMANDVISTATAPADVKKECELLIANTYFSEKAYDKATQKYGEFAYSHEKDKDFEMTAEALFEQGRAFEVQEFYNDAIKSWQILAGKYPKSKRAPEAIFKLSDIYNKAAQYDKALAGFQSIIEKYPKSDTAEDAMLSIAEVYYNSEQETKAVEAYKKFMVKYPDSNKVTSVDEGMQRASYRKAEKANDPKLLLEFYNKYPNSNLAVNALYKAAETYYTLNKFKEAIDAFNKVIQQFPNDSMAINANYYVGACYDGLQKSDDAVAAYKAFIKNYPKHELAPDVTFRLATAAYMAKNYVDAIFYYERIIERYPGTEYETNAMYNVALAYADSGKQDDSIVAYKRFAKTYPNDPKSKDIDLQIAGMYLEAKRYKEAVAAYDEVYKVAKDDATRDEALYRQGDIYAQTEQPDKAIEVYNLLMKAGPPENVFRVTALIALAGLYEEKSDWKNAVNVYEVVAVSNGPAQYVQGAKQRKEDIKAAYPDVFKAGGAASAVSATAAPAAENTPAAAATSTSGAKK